MSTETKHTPGPWEITRNTGKEIIVEGDKYEWERLECAVLIDDCCAKTGKANARLIAAAPELLEALQNLANEVTARGLNGFSQQVAKARAAITKATGTL